MRKGFIRNGSNRRRVSYEQNRWEKSFITVKLMEEGYRRNRIMGKNFAWNGIK